MPLSPSALRTQLSTIELDDATYAGLGPQDVDTLIEFLRDEEGWLAARAVHALSRIDDPRARAAILDASAMPRPEVRVAAAVAAQDLPTATSDELLRTLLDDPDVPVRKFAVRSVSPRNAPAVQARVRDLARDDTDQRIRAVAQSKASPT
jgi:HEAT repeat protein